MGCLLVRWSMPIGRSAWTGRPAGDEVFRDLVLARIIEPVSKLDSLRVLEEAGAAAASYRTVLRRLPVYAAASWREKLSAACAAHTRLGRASLILYDVSTLYFETDAGDEFREPRFSNYAEAPAVLRCCTRPDVAPHTAFAPVTGPVTRHSSPSSTWPSGGSRRREASRRVPGLDAAGPGAAGRSSGPQREAARRTAVGTGVPPASAPRSAGPDTRRIAITSGTAPGRKAGDGRGGRRVREHRHRRLDQVDRLAAERAEQQLPDQAAVVQVQPLGGGDEHAQSSGTACPAVARKKWACSPDSPLAGTPCSRAARRSHSSPWRRSGDAARRAGCPGTAWGPGPGKSRGAVVAEQDRGPAGKAGRGQAGPAHDRGQRVYLDADQGRLRPAAARGQEHPGRPGAGIHDPGRADPGTPPRRSCSR